MFDSLQPVNGLLAGDKVRPVSRFEREPDMDGSFYHLQLAEGRLANRMNNLQFYILFNSISVISGQWEG